MIYKDRDLPKGSIDKPYIYTNFVSTVDGKVQVLENWKSYWPIGSRFDHQVLTELRALSDVLIHGSNLARLFPFVETIQNPNLVSLRKRLKKRKILPYVVLSNRPDKKLVSSLKNPTGERTYLVTNKKIDLPDNIEELVSLIRIGDEKINLKELIKFLAQNLKAKRIIVEGGPTLVGSFLSENLIDEIFLTVAPKIFGSKPGKTLTLVENRLFPPKESKKLKLISVNQIEDELFLRYKILK